MRRVNHWEQPLTARQVEISEAMQELGCKKAVAKKLGITLRSINHTLAKVELKKRGKPRSYAELTSGRKYVRKA